MTNTRVFEPARPENPLFMKLRRRFSYEGDRTIADVKMEQVLRSEGSVKDRCHTAEFQYLMRPHKLSHLSSPFLNFCYTLSVKIVTCLN
jgi:hypothetical protein